MKKKHKYSIKKIEDTYFNFDYLPDYIFERILFKVFKTTPFKGNPVNQREELLKLKQGILRVFVIIFLIPYFAFTMMSGIFGYVILFPVQIINYFLYSKKESFRECEPYDTLDSITSSRYYDSRPYTSAALIFQGSVLKVWYVTAPLLLIGALIVASYALIPKKDAPEIIPQTKTTQLPLLNQARFEETRELLGRVDWVYNFPALSRDDECKIKISPTSETEFTGSGHNCHVKVECKGKVIYGWEGSGVTKCKVQVGKVISASDPLGAAEKDDPILDLNIADGKCIVRDNGKKTYHVSIRLNRE